MSGQTPEAPWNYLRRASPFTLMSYELSRLNHAANLRKQITTLLDQWLQETADAMLARWLFEARTRSQRSNEDREALLELSPEPPQKTAASHTLPKARDGTS